MGLFSKIGSAISSLICIEMLSSKKGSQSLFSLGIEAREEAKKRLSRIVKFLLFAGFILAIILLAR